MNNIFQKSVFWIICPLFLCCALIGTLFWLNPSQRGSDQTEPTSASSEENTTTEFLTEETTTEEETTSELIMLEYFSYYYPLEPDPDPYGKQAALSDEKPIYARSYLSGAVTFTLTEEEGKQLVETLNKYTWQEGLLDQMTDFVISGVNFSLTGTADVIIDSINDRYLLLSEEDASVLYSIFYK